MSRTLISSAVTRSPRSKKSCASRRSMKAIEASYSYIPERKIPETTKVRTFGMKPRGVGAATCGEMSCTFSPIVDAEGLRDVDPEDDPGSSARRPAARAARSGTVSM